MQTTSGSGQGGRANASDDVTNGDVLDTLKQIQGIRDARPNILIIMVDQLYYPNPGCFGSTNR
jgi:hypothetical protein